MFQKGLIVFLTLNYFCASLFSDTLYKNIKEVLETNPVVQERLRNFRAIKEDLNIAKSEFYPTLDLRLVGSYNKAGTDNKTILKHEVQNSQYASYESSITFTQNLFNGYSTTNQVSYQKSKSLVAAYKYIEKANETAFRMSEAYIKVLRTQELLKTAKQNVKINESIYSKVKQLFDSGLTTDSEVKKIHSSLSLARSKLTVADNSALEAQYKYRRILGRMPDIAKMKKPLFRIVMPSTVEEAALFAIEHNPSLLVSMYNIKSAEALYKQNHKGLYPKLDFEVSKIYNDSFPSNNGFTTPDDSFSARLILTYNIFRGGADKANIQKNISKINQEVELKRDVKRQVIEDLDIAWKFYEMTVNQLKDLQEYSSYAEETMVLYKEEYNLGRRTLLDLLSAQNDVINSREQIIKTKYDKLFAKYRILDAMGILIETVIGDASQYSAKVNLVSNNAQVKIVDILPFEEDIDNDKIIDVSDLCDNSDKGAKVSEYGCKKIFLDSDNDGVVDVLDKCLSTNMGVLVDKNGCELDTDGDGVVDSEDNCPNTLKGKKVSVNGCVVHLIETKTIKIKPRKIQNKISNIPDQLTIFYNKDSYKTSKKLKLKIKKIANFLVHNKNYDVIVTGHTSKEGSQSTSQWLSEKRAKNIVYELIDNGVDDIRISYEGLGDSEPIAFGNTQKDLKLNRRAEIVLVNISSTNSIPITINKDIKKIPKNNKNNFDSLDVDFIKNGYILSKDSNEEIQRFVNFLKKNKQFNVKIVSHINSIGSEKENMDLTSKRAENVVLALIKKGIDKQRLSFEGMGNQEPIAFGTSPEDMRLNDRIEVIFSKIKI